MSHHLDIRSYAILFLFFCFEIMTKAILLPNIRSGWNVGAFFRTADALGFDHVYLAGYTAQPPHKAISKTALGADAFVPWTGFATVPEAIESLKKEGFTLIGLELTNNAIALQNAHFPEKSCLVLGNEVEGIIPDFLEKMDIVVQIPMQGKKESLNVSIAGSIAMWEMAKKRG